MINLSNLSFHSDKWRTKILLSFWTPSFFAHHSNSTDRQLTECEGSRRKEKCYSWLLGTLWLSFQFVGNQKMKKENSSKSSRWTLWTGCRDHWWLLSCSSHSFPLWLPLICFAVVCPSQGQSSRIPNAGKLQPWHRIWKAGICAPPGGLREWVDWEDSERVAQRESCQASSCPQDTGACQIRGRTPC